MFRSLLRQRLAPSLCALVSLFFLSAPAFATYSTNITNAGQWLAGQQNADGSWGASDGVKFIQTAEVVQALRAGGLRNAAYYRGLTWLQNSASTNADYNARAALTLGQAGNDVSALLTGLQSAQNTAVTGRSGWGANSGYLQSPLDTALVLNSLSALGTTANVSAAITYLKSSQLSGGGWPVSQETVADMFSTAWAVKTLAPLQAQDSSLGTVLTNGVNALNGSVTSTSPIYLRAVAAHAALLAGKTSTAQTWLTTIASAQSNGNWSNKIYDTALALRALAAADGIDSAANQTNVSIPDAALRAAINSTLGRNGMDSITRTEMAKLTTLTASNLTIGDLTGLEYAANLTTLDVRNNNITSTAPVSGLTHLTTLLVDGNPVTGGGGGGSSADTPTLPEWAAILMGSLLLLTLYKRQAADKNSPQLSA